MFNEYYLNSIKAKYNYDDKTVLALAKIIPNLISYFGEEYEDLILQAILSCEIIPCSSKNTISKEKKKHSLSIKSGVLDIASIEIKGSEVCYFSDAKIDYIEDENKFVIKDVDRVIITAHTFNYDSPKGLEILTYGLVKLIKSFKDEFVIDENTLIKRTGFEVEKRHIIKDGDGIVLSLISHEGHGLEEGFNIYDTSQIVSLVLDDEYKCYDYDSIYTIARIIKETFRFKDTINSSEIGGNIDKFKEFYEKEKFEDECDNCLFLENEMFISVTREDKDELASKINEKLSKTVYDKLMNIYTNVKSKKEKITI